MKIPWWQSSKALTINGENDIPGKEDSKDCIENENCEFDSGNVARFAYCLILMASFWISECVPIAVTALFPYFLFPLFGLASGKLLLTRSEQNSIQASSVAVNYMKNTNFMLLGGLTVAIAIETSNLHRRIALGTLRIVGSSPRRYIK